MAGWNGIFYNGVFTCGWDFLANTTTAIGDVMIAASGDILTTNARYGDGFTFSSGSINGFNLQVNLARLIQGIYVVVTALPVGGNFTAIMYWYDATAGTIQLTLKVGASGQLQFFLGTSATTVGSASANGIIAANKGVYLQTDVTINSSTGVVKCYADVAGTSPIITNTGLNTQSSANAYVNQFWFEPNIYFDDFYGLDLTGSAPFNAVLGTVHCHWDPANSDASPNTFSTNPTQTTGNHYKNIDAATTPSGTAYNFSATVAQEELYGFPNLTATKVFVITEWMYTELDSAGTRTVSPTLLSSAAVQTPVAFTPGSTYGYYWQPSTIDPNTTNPWASGTVAAAQAADLGIIVES